MTESAVIKEKENTPKNSKKRRWIFAIVFSLILLGGSSGLLYWKISNSYVYTDNVTISAPGIDLAPENSGILQELFVNIGDTVSADTVVARVDNELIKAKTKGIVTATEDNIGKIFNRGEAVVSMLDPTALRVVARIDEDKGLSDIRVGQRAVFTVDSFGSKEYEGVVDEISPVSRAGDVVFNISDKREEKQFDVKIRFNTDAYSELKNGMSARLWIYK